MSQDPEASGLGKENPNTQKNSNSPTKVKS